MSDAEFHLRGVHDARLAIHAVSASPAWLWSQDGARVLWANPVGAAALGASDAAALAARTFSPADPQRRQIAQLAIRLLPNAAPRLERLRGFGAPLGGLVTGICTRLQFANGDEGVLVVAPPVHRVPPLNERLRQLVMHADIPMAAFSRDGTLVGSSPSAEPLVGLHDLSAVGLDQIRQTALDDGRAEAATALGRIVLQRVGSGSDIGLVAIIELARPSAETAPTSSPANTRAAAAEQPFRTETPDLGNTGGATAGSLTSAASPDAPPATKEEAPSPQPTAEIRQPLRFVWQMDAEGRFLLGSDEFMRLMGTQTATAFGRPWREIVEAFDLDPDDRVARAVATHETWSGITLMWPVDDPGKRLAVELSGLPLFDRDRKFAGYRGFGVCRDLDRLNELTALQGALPPHEPAEPRPLAADVPHPAPSPERIPAPAQSDEQSSPAEAPPPPSNDPETVLDISQNVVPFRPVGDSKLPTLTPVENSAFHELARQLSARLENETAEAETAPLDSEALATNPAPEPRPEDPEVVHAGQPDRLPPQALPHGSSKRDERLFDLMPSGLLIYRLEQLLYVNRAFLNRVGFDDRQALDAAGGLDALYIDPPDAVVGSSAETGTPVTVTVQDSRIAPAPADLFAIEWDGATALALILKDAAGERTAAPPVAAAEPIPASGQVNAEELGAILDTIAEGVIMFDATGRISACNRSAEALFGSGGDDLIRLNLFELFAPESTGAVRDYFDGVTSTGASLLDHGRDVLGRTREGGIIPLAMIMGRTTAESSNFFAVFRDLTQIKKDEAAQLLARRQAERAATAKADVLARVSHEIRTPLNAIIGFADVMIDERFGPLGHERYVEYLKDIRASGERVSAIVDEMLDLSRIETGKLDLAFGQHNINDLLEQCVAVMQPRANRERIIIRTSLAHTLPSIVADARTLRQIALNLIGNSIHLANAGGQVIVSTALSDHGDVVLRVRDTGHGMNDNELAAAIEPFGTPTPDQTPGHAGVNLALTKALVEANRAKFRIKSVPRSGTLIEVTFPQVTARA